MDKNKKVLIIMPSEKEAEFIHGVFKLYIAIKNDELFQARFHISILHQCRKDSVLEKKLKPIIVEMEKLYKPNLQSSGSFQNDDQEVVIIGIQNGSNINFDNIESHERSHRKRARYDSENLNEYNDSENGTNFEIEKNYSNQQKIIRPPAKKQRKIHQYFTSKNSVAQIPQISTSNVKICEKTGSHYQLLEEEFAGKNVQYLYIFDSDNKKLCYKYTRHQPKNRYVCNKCKRNNTSSVWAKLCTDENEKEYIEFGKTQHTCELQPFKSEKSTKRKCLPYSQFNIIDGHDKKPDYKLVKQKYGDREIQYLYIFDENDKSLCYKYIWNRSQKRFVCYSCDRKHHVSVAARIVKNKDGEDCLALTTRQHECELKKFDLN
uniref:Uncharacterized protein n=1 Tax=Panagrolaimus sp. ES5 TaxID=591445 RepID=A0AC34FLV6_9BILA